MARRRSGRRTRRTSRITPRRWLPFLALIGLTAGAIVITSRASDPEPVPDAVASPAGFLPVAAQPGALSTAWYCSGTAAGDEGTAELSVVVANLEDRGTRAEVLVTGSNGERRRTTVDVPANGRTRVVGAEVLSAPWIAMTVEVLGGRATVEREVTGPLGFDVSPCSTNASDRWYVPSGSTVSGSEEHLVLYNPFPDPASVDITFSTDAGRRAPRALHGLSIPARSLRVVDDLPAGRPEVATKVAARAGRLLVDRVQTHDGTGLPVPGSGDRPVASPAPEGLTVTPAIPGTAARWTFPEAVNTAQTRTQIALYNPGSRDAEIDLDLTYENAKTLPPVDPVQVTVRPGEELVVDLADHASIQPDVPYVVDVRSLQGVRVAAEQLVFGAPPAASSTSTTAAAKPVAGFTVTAGSPIAAEGWLLASRGGTPKRSSTVVVANPGARAVTVRVVQANSGSRSVVPSAAVTVPAGDRRVLDLTDAAANVALSVQADGPIVVSHTIVAKEGTGIARSLATPLPETVAVLSGG